MGERMPFQPPSESDKEFQARQPQFREGKEIQYTPGYTNLDRFLGERNDTVLDTALGQINIKRTGAEIEISLRSKSGFNETVYKLHPTDGISEGEVRKAKGSKININDVISAKLEIESQNDDPFSYKRERPQPSGEEILRAIIDSVKRG